VEKEEVQLEAAVLREEAPVQLVAEEELVEVVVAAKLLGYKKCKTLNYSQF